MSEMRNDICFDEQLKKEFIETLNFMVGLIPALKAENKSSNEMARLEELIKTKNEDVSCLERSNGLINVDIVNHAISASIDTRKKIISAAIEEKTKNVKSFYESREKIKAYRNYASAKWEYFKKLNFVFSKEEIESLTDELLICYFLFEGMGCSFESDRTKGIACPKDNNDRSSFIRAYEQSWNTFLKWIYNNIKL